MHVTAILRRPLCRFRGYEADDVRYRSRTGSIVVHRRRHYRHVPIVWSARGLICRVCRKVHSFARHDWEIGHAGGPGLPLAAVETLPARAVECRGWSDHGDFCTGLDGYALTCPECADRLIGRKHFANVRTLRARHRQRAAELLGNALAALAYLEVFNKVRRAHFRARV